MTELPLFEVQVDRSGSHLTLFVSGEVDALAAPALLEAFLRHNSPAASLVWIDVAGVSFFDSSGLLVVQQLQQRTSEGGGTFQLVDPSPAVERIMQITGLDQVIPAHRRQPTGT